MNKKKITVLVNKLAGYKSYVDFLSKRYEINVVDCKEDLNEINIDLILFTGGEDVSPSYYLESKGEYTHTNELRDKTEADYMYRGISKKNVPKLGICRGAQFLTVMNGGELIQDVNGHAISGTHSIDLKYRDIDCDFKITSTHHQMMFPYNLHKDNYEILATSTFFRSNKYLNGANLERKLPNNFEECEIIFYPGSKSLCIQGHPENFNCPENTQEECLNLIDNYLKL